MSCLSLRTVRNTYHSIQGRTKETVEVVFSSGRKWTSRVKNACEGVPNSVIVLTFTELLIGIALITIGVLALKGRISIGYSSSINLIIAGSLGLTLGLFPLFIYIKMSKSISKSDQPNIELA